MQHLESVAGSAAYGSKCSSYVQTDHPCSRDTDSHSVFQDIAADFDAEAILLLPSPH